MAEPAAALHRPRRVREAARPRQRPRRRRPREPRVRPGAPRLPALRADRARRRHRAGRLAQPLDRRARADLRRRPRTARAAGSTTSRSGSTRARSACARPTSSSTTTSTIEAAPSKHGVAQGFFLYGFEPGGNRIEVTTGGYFVYDPDFEPITWTAAERARGQFWGVQTIESFHTYGTPDVGRMTRSRFEILPFGTGEEEAAELPEPVRLTVTCSPTHGLDETVEVGDAAPRARPRGHAPPRRADGARPSAPRRAARRDGRGRDRRRVRRSAATRRRRSARTPSAVELLPLVHEHPRPPAHARDRRLSGGPPADRRRDARRRRSSEKSRSPTTSTTQLCFDPECDRCAGRSARRHRPARARRRAGHGRPTRLLEISVRVGVGPSLRYLRKQRGLRNLLRLSGAPPTGSTTPSPRTRDRDRRSFHYFTFNRLLDTWSWEREQAD